MKNLEDILSSDLPDIERLAQAFHWITSKAVGQAEREIEALKALGDRDGLIREQVKASTMKHAQSIFQQCCLHVTGRKAWDDQDTL